MTAMNETSTITLPEYHNLLALLLLNLNTPPNLLFLYHTRRRDDQKKRRRDNAHTEPGARQQNRASHQASYLEKETDLTHKTHHQRERRVSHQKRKTDKTSLPPTSAQTQTTHPREESHPKRQKEKKKNHTTHSRLTSQHHPATPADTDPHPIIRQLLHHPLPCLHISCRHPSLHPIRIPSTRLLTPATIPCPHTACRHCTHHLLYRSSSLYHHPCLHYCSQLYPCLSRSRYRSPSTCVPLPDGRYARLATHCSPVPSTQPPLSAYCTHVCLRYCDHLAIIMPTILGSAPVLTTLHRPHPLIVTPGHLRYHQSLTRVHSHSLPVPPPLPLADARSQGGFTVGRSRSLAPVPGVRLSFMVPLAGESPLADARLPPHPNGHLLLATARPYTPIHAYTVFASTPLVRIHAHILSSTPADILATNSVHAMLTVLHPTLPA